MERVTARFTPEECGKLEEVLQIVSKELMPEIDGAPPAGLLPEAEGGA